MTWAELEKLTLAAMEHAFDKEPAYSASDLKNLAIVAGIAHDKVKDELETAMDNLPY